MIRSLSTRLFGLVASIFIFGCANSATPRRAEDGQTAHMRYRGCLESYVQKLSVTEVPATDVADGAAVACHEFADAYATDTGKAKTDDMVQEGREWSVATVNELRKRAGNTIPKP